MWPTPQAHDAASAKTSEQVEMMRARTGAGVSNLNEVVALLWPTPNAHDGRRPGADLKSTQGANLSRDATLWQTPSVADVTGGHKTRGGARSGELLLKGQADLWATPSARDWKSDGAEHPPEHSPPLGRQVLRIETAGDDGSRSAVLNPCFVEALMGFPPSWTVPTDCAASATPSSPSKREPRSSSSQGGC